MSWWWVNENYKCNKLDSSMHAVIVRLILSLLKHLRMRSYDVKTPQCFLSGVLLDNTDRLFWTCNSSAAFSLSHYCQPCFYFILCLHVLIKSYSFIPFINVISDAPKWKITPPHFSKPSSCLFTCMNKTAKNTAVFCIKFHWSWTGKTFHHRTLLHIRQCLVSCWTEIAKMTALSKYRGHISTPNTSLWIILTVRTKRLYWRDVCSRKRGGKKKESRQRIKESRIQPVQPTKCVLVKHTEGGFEPWTNKFCLNSPNTRRNTYTLFIT